MLKIAIKFQTATKKPGPCHANLILVSSKDDRVLKGKLNQVQNRPNLLKYKIMITSTKGSPQQKIRDYLGIFPNMGGGSSQFPKLKTTKKCP